VEEATTRSSTRSRSPWHRESKQASTRERIVERGVQQHEKEKESNKKAKENEEQPALYTDVDHADSSPKEIEKETRKKSKTKIGEKTSEKKTAKSEKLARKQHFEKGKDEESKCSAASCVTLAAHDSSESDVCWKEERRVPRTGLKGSCVLTQAGRESFYFVVTFSDCIVCAYAYSMSIYIYIYITIFVCIPSWIFVYIPFHTQIYTSTWIFTYIHAYKQHSFKQHSFIHACIQRTYTHAYERTCIQIFIHTYIHTFIYTYMYTHKYKYRYIHIYMHTYMYTYVWT